MEELSTWVRRGAERRLIEAFDAEEPGRAVERERVRAHAAARSLERLGVAPEPRARVVDAIDRRAAAEGIGPPEWRTSDPRIPVRALAAPLHMQRFLIAGWTRLSRAEQETWQALEAATPNGLLIGEIAWAACDGRRTIDEIARLVWLETGQSVPAFVTSVFEWAERLGESGWAPVADPASTTRG
jgi:hypothetical protein